jgi:hypothetical protein
METKEDIIKYIKETTGWSDEQCLSWYNQQEKMEREIETVPSFVAYCTVDSLNRKRYKILPEHEFDENRPKNLYDYRRCHTEKAAKEQLRSWKIEYS